MTRHTPGPWTLNTVFGDSTGAVSVSHDSWKNNSHPIARVYRRLAGYDHPPGQPFQSPRFDNAEAMANAKLIAAAPELLKALDNLAFEAKGYCADLSKAQIDCTTLIGAIKQARRAIDAATSEQ